MRPQSSTGSAASHHDYALRRSRHDTLLHQPVNASSDNHNFFSNIFHAVTIPMDVKRLHEEHGEFKILTDKLREVVMELEKEVVELGQDKVDHQAVGKLKEEYKKAMNKYAQDLIKYNKDLKAYTSFFNRFMGSGTIPTLPVMPHLDLSLVRLGSHNNASHSQHDASKAPTGSYVESGQQHDTRKGDINLQLTPGGLLNVGKLLFGSNTHRQ